MSKKDLSILDNPQYDCLDPILQSLYEKHVQMNEEKRKFIVDNLNERIDKIILHLKNTNPIFEKYFNRIVYTGSFWERIRVKEATEFDVNLVFKLPNGLKITADHPPGYAFINLADIPWREYYSRHPHYHPFYPRNRTTSEVVKRYYRTPRATEETLGELLHWTDQNDPTITPDRFLSWLESIFQKAGITLCQSFSKSGPALTVTIDFDRRVTVDFTPVFEVFENNGGGSWFAVPKPYKTYQSFRKTWRISHCEEGKRILKQRKMLKFILKIVKKIRDNLEIYKLASYHIKNLFLLEHNNLDWSKHSGRLFIHMLNKLEEVLDEQYLPSFFDSRFNLFDSLDANTMMNMHGQIKNFIQKMRLILNKSENKHHAILEHYPNNNNFKTIA